MGGDGVQRWPVKPMSTAMGPAFPLNTDNPVARATAVRTMQSHNTLIHKTKHCIDDHEDRHITQYRKYRKAKPNFGMWGMDNLQKKIAKDMDDDVMGQGISKAKAVVDTSTPDIAWAYREHADMLREHTLNDPSYKESQGYEIQWSVQEAAHARRNLHCFERAKHAKGYLKHQGMIHEGKKTIQFRKWRDQGRNYRMEKAVIAVDPPLKEPSCNARLMPSVAFPGPRVCSGIETPDLGSLPPMEVSRNHKRDAILHNMHFEMNTRLQVSGKIRPKVRERFEDDEEEKAAQAQGLAPGTVHPHFGKHAGKALPDELQMVKPTGTVPIDGIPPANPEVEAHANAARDYLLEQLTCKSQQMAMQSASNDRVRALLVKQNKVRDATARNKRKNRRSDSPAISRPQTQMTKNSSKTMPSPQRRATSVQPRRRKPKDAGARHQEELRQRIDQEMAQLNHNVQQAVNAGRQVAQSTIHATGSIMQAAPVQQQPSEYMYKARVLKDWQNGDGSHLRVTQGDVVFVFEDDESGCFECMDERGTVGRLPQNLLQFEEQVPRLRPIDLMGPAPA